MSGPTIMPTTGKTLYINTIASPSRKMGIFNMTPTVIKSLANGKHVRIFVPTANGLKYLSKITLRGICAFCPAVASALKAHNSAGGGVINDIVLPAHPIASYKKVLGWMRTCIEEGKVGGFKKHDGRGALRAYREVRDLAVALGIGWLVNGMNRRIEAITHAGQ